MKKLAIIYDRGSDRKQADNYSRKDAKQEGIRIAERYGFEWEYHKEIGSGATLAKRPVMLSILDRIEEGEVQGIICQELDRLARPEERSTYETIRDICLANEVLVYTQSGVFNFANDNDDFMADIQVAVAKKERRTIIKRSLRGMKQRAAKGKHNGRVPFGYKLIYRQDRPEEKPEAELIIDESQRTLVEKIFDYYLAYSANETANKLNLEGNRKPDGSMFQTVFILRMIQKPIYAGFMTWGRDKKHHLLREFEPTMVYRPNLQIVSVDIWEKAQALKKQRSLNTPHKGKWSLHPFSGLLRCNACGGPMYATSQKRKFGRYVQYYCEQKIKKGKGVCSGRMISQKLVAKAVIPVMASIIQSQIDMQEALTEAADKYGRTFSEDELKRNLEAELTRTKEAKSRLVKAIATNLLTKDEAKVELNELRQTETRLNQELATIGQKAVVREDYLKAIEAINSDDIEATLWAMFDQNPKTLKQLSRFMFQRASLVIEAHGKGLYATAELVDWEFTEDFAYTAESGIIEQTALNDAICNSRRADRKIKHQTEHRS